MLNRYSMPGHAWFFPKLCLDIVDCVEIPDDL